MESSQQTSHLVLVSGANGFIATEIVLAFLQAGYRVRGTVRSQAKADAWLALPAIAPYTSSFEGIAPLSVVLVEDITISGAFDEALAGATYFVHTISKLADWRLGAKQDFESDLLYPNINGTLESLRSASRTLSVRKVIILGTQGSTFDLEKSIVEEPTSGKTWNPRDASYLKTVQHPLRAYCACKAIAEREAWKYMEENKPHFTLTTMLPPFVYGISHGLDPFGVNNSSNMYLAGPLFRSDWNFAVAGGQSCCVDLEDVARAHVLAAERDEANGQRLMVAPSFVSICPSDYVPIFAREFPERAHLLPSIPLDLVNAPMYTCDGTATEATLGMRFRSPEETIIRTARWMLEAGGTEAWAKVGKVF